jgi:hypothetical protein
MINGSLIREGEAQPKSEGSKVSTDFKQIVKNA